VATGADARTSAVTKEGLMNLSMKTLAEQPKPAGTKEIIQSPQVPLRPRFERFPR
jgi:hypothetical protein